MLRNIVSKDSTYVIDMWVNEYYMEEHKKIYNGVIDELCAIYRKFDNDCHSYEIPSKISTPRLKRTPWGGGDGYTEVLPRSYIYILVLNEQYVWKTNISVQFLLSANQNIIDDCRKYGKIMK